MQYVNSEDFIQRLEWIQYKRKMKPLHTGRVTLQEAFESGFKSLSLVYYNTKKTHKIKGWAAVVEDGTPLFDIYTGSGCKYFDEIKQAFLTACEACHIEVIK